MLKSEQHKELFEFITNRSGELLSSVLVPSFSPYFWLIWTGEDSDDYQSFDEITSRTQFPESWLWAEEILPDCPDKNKLW